MRILQIRASDVTPTYGNSHIEYSDNESREVLTDHATPESSQRTSVTEPMTTPPAAELTASEEALRQTRAIVNQVNTLLEDTHIQDIPDMVTSRHDSSSPRRIH